MIVEIKIRIFIEQNRNDRINNKKKNLIQFNWSLSYIRCKIARDVIILLVYRSKEIQRKYAASNKSDFFIMLYEFKDSCWDFSDSAITPTRFATEIYIYILSYWTRKEDPLNNDVADESILAQWERDKKTNYFRFDDMIRDAF